MAGVSRMCSVNQRLRWHSMYSLATSRKLMFFFCLPNARGGTMTRDKRWTLRRRRRLRRRWRQNSLNVQPKKPSNKFFFPLPHYIAHVCARFITYACGENNMFLIEVSSHFCMRFEFFSLSLGFIYPIWLSYINTATAAAAAVAEEKIAHVIKYFVESNYKIICCYRFSTDSNDISLN